MCDDTTKGFHRLIEVVAKLRGEGGCPWDREQTLDSLKQYLIEESYELLDAIDSADVASHKDELGDVLLQVALQSRIREEEGQFTFDDVADKLSEKLIRRHPHVFGDAEFSDSKEVLENWEAIKAKEKKDGNRSAVDGVPRHLPNLRKAHRVQTVVARVGFDWDDASDVIAKVDEELAELKQAIINGDESNIKEEIGDLIFSIVNLSRFQKMNAEEALDDTITKFTRRFQEVEKRIWGEGKQLAECTLEEMDVHWENIKREEREAD